MPRKSKENRLRADFNTRQYMVSRDFEVYYYSDTNMKNVSSHFHNYYEFYFFLDGDVSLTVGDLIIHLIPGNVILIPPKVRHHLTVNNRSVPYKRFIFWINKDYCNSLMKEDTDYGYIFQQAAIQQKYVYHLDPIVFNTLQGKLINLLEELHSDRFGHNANVRLCVSDLMLSLNRNIYELENTISVKEESSLYEKIIAYLDDHIIEDVTLDNLSEEFFVSKYHIAHLFKSNMGISVHQFLLKKRLLLCKDAILSGAEITATYLQYGFHDYSSFYRAFKKEYALSPKEFGEIYRYPKEKPEV